MYFIVFKILFLTFPTKDIYICRCCCVTIKMKSMVNGQTFGVRFLTKLYFSRRLDKKKTIKKVGIFHKMSVYTRIYVVQYFE